MDVQGQESLKQALEKLAQTEGSREGLMTLAEAFEKIGEQKGREEGISVGRDQGLQEGLFTAARRMKDQGLPTETIVACTGLSPEVIQGL